MLVAYIRGQGGGAMGITPPPGAIFYDPPSSKICYPPWKPKFMTPPSQKFDPPGGPKARRKTGFYRKNR